MSSNAVYAQGLGRAFIGALLFASPLFMTMEMWQFGFTMDPLRLVALLIAGFALLVPLSYFAGFERAFGLLDHVLDAFAAIAIAAFTALIVFMLFAVLQPEQPLAEIVAKIAVATFPGAIGALLADKQLGSQRNVSDASDRSYLARLFLMAIGALFVALNVAPTEEMMLIAFQSSPWHIALVIMASVALLHGLLFWVDFPGRDERRGDRSFWSVLLRYSFAGFGLCVLSSFALLWAFGRIDGVGFAEMIEFVAVLSFPAALGAGLAHLVVGEQRG